MKEIKKKTATTHRNTSTPTRTTRRECKSIHKIIYIYMENNINFPFMQKLSTHVITSMNYNNNICQNQTYIIHYSTNTIIFSIKTNQIMFCMKTKIFLQKFQEIFHINPQTISYMLTRLKQFHKQQHHIPIKLKIYHKQHHNII